MLPLLNEESDTFTIYFLEYMMVGLGVGYGGRVIKLLFIFSFL